MKLELTNEEIEILNDLVFLGNWVINSIRLHGEKIEKYQNFFEKIENSYSRFLEFTKREFFFDMESKLESYINDYDNEGCFFTLAKMLAQANFPEEEYGFFVQSEAEGIYQKYLLEKGISCVVVDEPNLNQLLKNK